MTKHGLHGTPTHSSWRSMWGRCTSKSNKSYPNYGGKGITVCERWRSIENFVADVGLRPSLDHSIERERSSDNYEPGNCRWATRVEQNNNKSDNNILEFDGRRQSIAAWAREVGLQRCTISYRIHHGWSVEQALTDRPSFNNRQREAMALLQRYAR